MSNTTPPRSVRNVSELASIVRSFARARLELRGTRRGARVRCHGRVLVPRRAGVAVGSRTIFLGGSIPTELRCGEGAELSIGEQTLVNYGVSVAARRRVQIGARCMVASLVHIRDDDGRRTAPVTIGDDVWIAHGAIIEPGTTIGDGSVIGTMAVVSGDVPPRSLAAGNPARFVPLGVAIEASEAPAMGPSAPSLDEVRAAVIDWLDDTRLFGEAASLVTSDDQSLRQGGLLDSLGVVQLLLMLEKTFGVTIDRERANRPDGLSVSVLAQLVAPPASAETTRRIA